MVVVFFAIYFTAMFGVLYYFVYKMPSELSGLSKELQKLTAEIEKETAAFTSQLEDLIESDTKAHQKMVDTVDKVLNRLKE
jgi:uncharacterized phage infection (PIP) family protein YhgE